MIIRYVTAAALGALMFLTPFQAQAQLKDVVKACTRSLTLAIGCIIIERGIEKGVEVGLDSLIKVALGQTTDLVRKRDLTKKEVADINASGIGWTQLKDFLVSTFKSGAPVDDATIRAVAADSCRANYQPVCSQLGFADPRNRPTDCSAITVEQDCKTKISCSWSGTVCTRFSGTRDLLKR
jgi:hypothetical protein